MWDAKQSPILMAKSFHELRNECGTQFSTMRWNELQTYIADALEEIERLRVVEKTAEEEMNTVEAEIFLRERKHG